MTAFIVEYHRHGCMVNSRRITRSEATFLRWVEELTADPEVHDVVITHSPEAVAG